MTTNLLVKNWPQAIASTAISTVISTGISPVALAFSFSLEEATIAHINEAFNNGFTSEQLVQLYLNRIDTYDPKINSVLYVNPNALAEARSLDRERQKTGPRSPLHGIPIFLKDNIDTFDMPTTGGSDALAGSKPTDDAFAVQLFRDAGAIILGKTEMDEFAISGGGYSSIGGTTLNPYRFTRSSAGSSSGSGAAIAANFAVFAMGSDTGGSIRTPCSFQGLVCIRPTRGLVSLDGVIPFVLSRDAIGPMARTVADAATALGVLAVYDPNNPTLSTPIDEPSVQLDKFYSDYTQFLNPNGLKGTKLGLVTNYVGMGVDPLITQYVQDAVAVMKAQGAEVFEVTFDNTFLTTMSRTYGAATPYEQKIYLEEYLSTLDNDIYPENLGELIAALESPIVGDTTTSRILGTLRNSNSLDRTIINANYQSRAVEATPIVRQTLLDTLDAQDLDAFIFPTVNVFARVPTNFSDPTFINYNPVAAVRQVEFASSVGFPDITVPIGADPLGLPVTLSITGKPYEEATLIRIAYSLEQATLARRASPLLPPLPGEKVSVPESRMSASLIVVGITLVGLRLRKRPKLISAIAENC